MLFIYLLPKRRKFFASRSVGQMPQGNLGILILKRKMMSLHHSSDLGMCCNQVKDQGGQEGSQPQGARNHLFVQERETQDT